MVNSLRKRFEEESGTSQHVFPRLNRWRPGLTWTPLGERLVIPGPRVAILGLHGDLRAPLSGPWHPRRDPWAPLGDSWDPRGDPWDPLANPMALLGDPWAPLGVPCAPLGDPWVPQGDP